jgi:cytochrome c biogenesis protein CcdA
MLSPTTGAIALRTTRPFLPRSLVLLAALLTAATVALGWLAIARTQGREALAESSRLRTAQIADVTAALTRVGSSAEGTQAEVILATPDFFQLTNRTADAGQLGADRALTFVANETVHYGELESRFAPILRVDGATLAVPSEVQVLADAVHHRTTVVSFTSIDPERLREPHTFELLLPQNPGGTRDVLAWTTPIAYPDSVQSAGLSLGLLLALAAGLMAAISPCLLQLTAYYLPTLAGVSAGAPDGTTSAENRRRILKTASIFILGFTIPYTLGGAAMGGMGQALAASGVLNPTGPLALGSGAVMIAMALLVARQARAPLVCKLPLPAGLSSPSRRLGAFTPFVSGFAIATGCLACFGGAILGVLLVYGGMLGSWSMGALAMFLFSMGLAIPFMLAALGLSPVLSAARRLQPAAPIIGLATSAIMLFFGVVMASGNFHVVSGWLRTVLPLG